MRVLFFSSPKPPPYIRPATLLQRSPTTLRLFASPSHWHRSNEQIPTVTMYDLTRDEAVPHEPQIRLGDVIGLCDSIGEGLALEE